MARNVSQPANDRLGLPEDLDLPRAFKEKRRFIEKYARVSELLNEGPLMKWFPSPDATDLLDCDSKGRTTKAAQDFFKIILQTSDETTDKAKWETLRKTLAAPGHELLCYILKEKEEKLHILEIREKLVRETFRKELLDRLETIIFCNEFNFSAYDREKIQCETRLSGKTAGNRLILKCMVKYLNWFPDLLQILDNHGHKKLAKKLREKDPQLKDSPARNTRSSHRQTIPMVDNPDKVARSICNTLSTCDNFDDGSSGATSDCSFNTGSYDSSALFGFQSRSTEMASNFSKASKDALLYTHAGANYTFTTDGSSETNLKSYHDGCEDSHKTHDDVYRSAKSLTNLALSDELENSYSSDTLVKNNAIGFHTIQEKRETKSLCKTGLKGEKEATSNADNADGEIQWKRPSAQQRVCAPNTLTSCEIYNKQLKSSILTSPNIDQCQHYCTKGVLSADKRDQHHCTTSSPIVCDSCDLYVNKSPVKHLELISPATYRCKHCSKAFLSIDKRDQHVCPKNSPRPSFNSNPNMGTRAKKSPENRLGLSLPSSPTIYRCNDCTKGFLSADKRDQHTCLKIPTSFSKRANDAGGQQSQNPSEKQLASDNPASPTIYRCIHCTKGFFSADKRDQHVCPKNPPRASINSNPNMGPRAKNSPENRLGLSLPSSPTIYRCNDCSKGFLSADKRDEHTCLKIPTSPSRRANDARGQQSKRPSEASDTPASPTIYRCKHCTKGFLSEDNRDQHHCHQSL